MIEIFNGGKSNEGTSFKWNEEYLTWRYRDEIGGSWVDLILQHLGN